MENWERRFDRVQAPDSSVPSHYEGLRKKLLSNKIPASHGRRTIATLGIMALVMFSGLTLVYPSWAKDLWKTALVQTITLHTKDGRTVMIKKMECNEGACPAICDTSACDSSWSMPDGRQVFRKRIRPGSDATGPMRIAMACVDTSRLTTLLREGLEFTPPSGETVRISNPDGDKIWIVNGDTIEAKNMTMAMSEMSDMSLDSYETPPDPTAATKDNLTGVNTNFELLQNYPNPFNPTTQISFNLDQSGPVTLKVYNMMGQEVATLLNGYTDAGRHAVTFDGTNLPSGTYLYALQTASSRLSRTMILAK